MYIYIYVYMYIIYIYIYMYTYVYMYNAEANLSIHTILHRSTRVTLQVHVLPRFLTYLQLAAFHIQNYKLLVISYL